jgi:hypothetical protein
MIYPENNGETTRREGGVTGRGWVKGKSGNPRGRPKSFARLIREETRDGTALVEVVLDIFRGRHGADARTRLDAATLLANRAFGRPPTEEELSELDSTVRVVSLNLRELGATELALLESLINEASSGK